MYIYTCIYTYTLQAHPKSRAGAQALGGFTRMPRAQVPSRRVTYWFCKQSPYKPGSHPRSRRVTYWFCKQSPYKPVSHPPIQGEGPWFRLGCGGAEAEMRGEDNIVIM